jgi:hypothetical protein
MLTLVPSGTWAASAAIAGEHEHRIWAAVSQDGECPGDHQHEVSVRLEIKEGAQHLDRSAGYRGWRA